MHLLQQQMAASGMAATADHHVAAAAAGPTMMPVATMSPLTSASMEGSVAAAPSAQSAQSLLHTSLSGSLTAQTAAAATAAVCGTNSCPELPQVRVDDYRASQSVYMQCLEHTTPARQSLAHKKHTKHFPPPSHTACHL